MLFVYLFGWPFILTLRRRGILDSGDHLDHLDKVILLMNICL